MKTKPKKKLVKKELTKTEEPKEGSQQTFVLVVVADVQKTKILLPLLTQMGIPPAVIDITGTISKG